MFSGVVLDYFVRCVNQNLLHWTKGWGKKDNQNVRVWADSLGLLWWSLWKILCCCCCCYDYSACQLCTDFSYSRWNCRDRTGLCMFMRILFKGNVWDMARFTFRLIQRSRWCRERKPMCYFGRRGPSRPKVSACPVGAFPVAGFPVHFLQENRSLSILCSTRDCRQLPCSVSLW